MAGAAHARATSGSCCTPQRCACTGLNTSTRARQWLVWPSLGDVQCVDLVFVTHLERFRVLCQKHLLFLISYLGGLGWVWREKVLQEADPEMSAEKQGMGLLWIDGRYDLQSRIAKSGE